MLCLLQAALASAALLNDYDVSCTTAGVYTQSVLQVGTAAFTSPRLESGGQVQYQFLDDWLWLGTSFVYLVYSYPPSRDCKVKLDSLERLKRQVWYPASTTSKIQSMLS